MSSDTRHQAGAKIQGHIPQFHKFVISSLIGVEGTNESDVLARIIGFWIRDNESWLAARGITHENWRVETANPEAKEGRLYRYAAARDGNAK